VPGPNTSATLPSLTNTAICDSRTVSEPPFWISMSAIGNRQASVPSPVSVHWMMSMNCFLMKSIRAMVVASGMKGAEIIPLRGQTLRYRSAWKAQAPSGDRDITGLAGTLTAEAAAAMGGVAVEALAGADAAEAGGRGAPGGGPAWPFCTAAMSSGVGDCPSSQ
jgi:hypothetical protein